MQRHCTIKSSSVSDCRPDEELTDDCLQDLLSAQFLAFKRSIDADICYIYDINVVLRLQVGKSYASAREALLLNGSFVINQLKAFDARTGQGSSLAESPLTATLQEEVSQAWLVFYDPLMLREPFDAGHADSLCAKPRSRRSKRSEDSLTSNKPAAAAPQLLLTTVSTLCCAVSAMSGFIIAPDLEGPSTDQVLHACRQRPCKPAAALSTAPS